MKGVIIIEWLNGGKEEIAYESYFVALQRQREMLKEYKGKMKSCAVKAICD